MFVCYLDDSGGDSENPITALAGYVAMEAAWTLFERNVEPVFKEFGVEVLHAVNLHNTKGDFKLWPRDKKEKFVSRVCEAMAPNVLLGISVSVDKEIYQARREESRATGDGQTRQPILPIASASSVIGLWNRPKSVRWVCPSSWSMRTRK